MKSLIVPLLATASFSTFLICGMVAASSFNIHYTPHKFANIDNTIWTSTPIRIDRSEQGLIREPGTATVQTAATSEPAASTPNELSARVVPVLEETAGQQSVAADAPAAVEWCQARYRSYRETDNSYQPFSGGPRQQCNAPGQVTRVGMTVNDSASSNLAQNLEPSHAAWCEQKYSSYRLTDDTYQPLGGGERRACASPSSSGANG